MGLSDTLAARFDVESHGSDVRTELVAGLTTFLAMSYIIVVNPAILSDAIQIEGYGQGEVFQMIAIATILSAAIGTVVMALYANRPFGLAPGLGSTPSSRTRSCWGSGSRGRRRSRRCSSRASRSCCSP